MNESNDIKPLLAEVARGATLTREQASAAFEAVMTGQASEAQIAALLTALQVRTQAGGSEGTSAGGGGGPTVDEITGAAEAMRRHALHLQVPESLDVVDTCGTGGDHASTFNISTAAAIVAAGAGVPVAKHGNRSVTSRSGSSQVLEALGVRLDVPPDVLSQCLTQANLCFCFAPAHHPAMKHAGPVRQQLGFRTIFNLLGPLTNPAGARRQVIGVFRRSLTEPIARVLTRLGAVHAMVVHGSGLDEITLAGPTQITTTRNKQVTTTTISPDDFDLPAAPLDALRVDSVEQSADVIRRVLAGETGPARDITAVNAAAALVVADKADDLAAALPLAFESIDTGAAATVLTRLTEITNG